MSNFERFLALISAILVSSAVLFNGLYRLIRIVIAMKGTWDATNAELGKLVTEVRDLIVNKEQDHKEMRREHARLARRVTRIERNGNED